MEHLRALVAHKGFADAALLRAIHDHDAAAGDATLRGLLHHVLVANRFWMLTIVGEPFVADVELQAPESFDALGVAFRDLHARETAWLATASAGDFGRTLESPVIPGGRCTVSDALLQVCLHGQGHRAQCATRLRALGGTPPATDFIVWLAHDRASQSSP